jgi:hypothetical protein
MPIKKEKKQTGDGHGMSGQKRRGMSTRQIAPRRRRASATPSGGVPKRKNQKSKPKGHRGVSGFGFLFFL